MAGEEVVQVYVSQAQAPSGAKSPIRALAAFDRVALRPGERKTILVTVPARQFSATASDGRRRVQPGTFQITAGGKQPGFRGLADASTTAATSASLQIAGPAKELN
jgi:beta-glucosidase